MLPSLLAHPDITVVAAADRDPQKAEQFGRHFEVAAHRDVSDLAADARVEAVYVATPHQFHADHACTLAAAGKHLLVEKPMAISVPECVRMVDAARAHGVALVVGHTHGSSPGTLLLRRLVASGRFGELRSLLGVNYTDFVYRPRRAEELDTRSGGGAIFNQLPHHVDAIRTVHPTGTVSSVVGRADARDPSRPTEGAYSVLLDMEGVAATLVYSGYGHFDSDEWYGWVAESGYAKDPHTHQKTWADWERRRQQEAPEFASGGAAAGSWQQALLRASQPLTGLPHFGILIASLDGGDLVTVPEGVLVVSSHGRELVGDDASGPGSRKATLDEFHRAARGLEKPLHDARWGLETVATCLAVLASSQWGRQVRVGDPAAVSASTILDAMIPGSDTGAPR